MVRASVRRGLAPVVLSLVLSLPGAVRDASPGSGEPRADDMDRLASIEQAISGMDRTKLPLLREWAARDRSDRVRERSIGALTLLEDLAIGTLLQERLAGDPSGRVRRAAAESAGILRLGSLRATLSELLTRDRDPYVRAECARALGRIPGPDGNLLLAALVTDPSPEVRAICAETLIRLKPRDFLDVLHTAAWQDPSVLVRIYAVRGLAEVDPSGSALLFQRTWESSEDPDLRMEAFRGLLRSGRGEGRIEAGLADADERIRFLAFRYWIHRSYPGMKTGGQPQASGISTVELERFLSDPVRGIRELAREELERRGFRLRPSGFGYKVDR